MPSRHGASVSLCMIVRNEERNLKDCLEPIAHLFDEIVIVDTGSGDRTKEIARQYTPLVHDFVWCDDFAAARNESLRHASGDWVFWLDADDRIMPSEIENLQSLLNGLDHRDQAYMLNTVCHKQYSCDGVQFLTHARLFRSHTELQWKGRVHEQLRPSPIKLGYELLTHPLRIEHLGYADGSQQLKKQQRNIRLLRMDFAADPEDESTLVHLALAHSQAGNLAESKKYLRILINREFPIQDWQRRVYELLVEQSMQEGDYSAALRYSAQGLERFPGDIPLIFIQAQVFFSICDYNQCAGNLLKIITLPEDTLFYAGAAGFIREKKAPWMLAETLKMQGNLKQANEVLIKVIQKYPEDLHCLYSLGENYLSLGQRHQLTLIREHMQSIQYGRVFSLALLIREHMADRHLEALNDNITELISLAPKMPLARILRVQYLQLIGAPLEDRLAACRDVLRVFPNHPDIIKETQGIEAMQQFGNLMVKGNLYEPIVVMA